MNRGQRIDIDRLDDAFTARQISDRHHLPHQITGIADQLSRHLTGSWADPDALAAWWEQARSHANGHAIGTLTLTDLAANTSFDRNQTRTVIASIHNTGIYAGRAGDELVDRLLWWAIRDRTWTTSRDEICRAVARHNTEAVTVANRWLANLIVDGTIANHTEPADDRTPGEAWWAGSIRGLDDLDACAPDIARLHRHTSDSWQAFAATKLDLLDDPIVAQPLDPLLRRHLDPAAWVRAALSYSINLSDTWLTATTDQRASFIEHAPAHMAGALRELAGGLAEHPDTWQHLHGLPADAVHGTRPDAMPAHDALHTAISTILDTAGDTARALWPAWAGTLAELIDTAHLIGAGPAAPAHTCGHDRIP